MRSLEPANFWWGLSLLAINVLVGLAWLFWYAQPAQFSIAPESAAYSQQGFRDVERLPDSDMSYRWSNGDARLLLPNPGGTVRLRLLLAGGPGREVPLTLLSGTTQLSFNVGAEPRHYHVLLPPSAAERLQLELRSPTFADPAGSGRLGVVVGELRVSGAGWPPLNLTLLLLVMLPGSALLLRQAGMRRPMAMVLPAVLVGGLLGWHMAGGWAAMQTMALAALLAQALLMLAPAICLWRTAPALPVAPLPRRRMLLLSGGLALFGGLALWNQIVVHPGLASDFGIYLEAAARADQGGDPYQPFLIGRSFVYPPVALLWFVPLARLPLPLAEAYWHLGNFALYALALLSLASSLRLATAHTDQAPATAPAAGGVPPRYWLFFGLAALLYAPFWESLAIGQINSLMLLGMLLFLHGNLDRRLAGVGDVALALVILVKPTPALLLFWPLVRRDWPRLLRIGPALAGLVLLAYYCFGLQPWLQFGAILPQLLAGEPLNPFNQSVAGLLARLSAGTGIGEWVGGLAGPLWILALLAIWLLAGWRGRRLVSAQETGLLLSLGIAVVTLISSLVWYHHLVLLLAPLAWLIFGGRLAPAGLSLLLGSVWLIQANRLLESLGVPAGLPAVAGYLLLLGILVRQALLVPARPG